jgi:hypothetical protein
MRVKTFFCFIIVYIIVFIPVAYASSVNIDMDDFKKDYNMINKLPADERKMTAEWMLRYFSKNYNNMIDDNTGIMIYNLGKMSDFGQNYYNFRFSNSCLGKLFDYAFHKEKIFDRDFCSQCVSFNYSVLGNKWECLDFLLSDSRCDVDNCFGVIYNKIPEQKKSTFIGVLARYHKRIQKPLDQKYDKETVNKARKIVNILQGMLYKIKRDLFPRRLFCEYAFISGDFDRAEKMAKTFLPKYKNEAYNILWQIYFRRIVERDRLITDPKTRDLFNETLYYAKLAKKYGTHDYSRRLELLFRKLFSNFLAVHLSQEYSVEFKTYRMLKKNLLWFRDNDNNKSINDSIRAIEKLVTEAKRGAVIQKRRNKERKLESIF